MSRALGMAVRSADAQGDAVGVLQEYGLCTPPPPMDSSTGGTDETNDMWADVGVRACATLLLRRGQIGAALDLLKAIVTPAQSLHAFLTAFELASRLPAPPLTTPAPATTSSSSAAATAAATAAAPPMRFTTEHMLEVLDGAPEMNSAGGNLMKPLPRPAYRPLTKFEARGERLGHGVWDWIYYRA